MMSSVAPRACFHVVFIAYCLASSREKTMMRFGWPSPPASSRRVSVWPSDPVPPVMRTTASSSVGVMALFLVLGDHLVPGGDRDARGLPEPRAAERAVDPRLGDRPDVDVQPERSAQPDEQVVLVDRVGGHLVEPGQPRMV